MTTQSRVHRTQWIHRDEPKPEPHSVRTAKALRLPKPGPGITVNVPLSIEPEYLDVYDLVPMTLGEVRDVEKALGIRKAAGVLWVKRVKKGSANG